MIEGLFWAAVLFVLYYIVDYFTAPKEDQTKEERRDQVTDRTLVSLCLGIVGFLVVGLMFF